MQTHRERKEEITPKSRTQSQQQRREIIAKSAVYGTVLRQDVFYTDLQQASRIDREIHEISQVHTVIGQLLWTLIFLGHCQTEPTAFPSRFGCNHPT